MFCNLCSTTAHRRTFDSISPHRCFFAGPLVTCAVILPKNFCPNVRIHDSKLLSKNERCRAAKVILSEAIAYSIVEIPLKFINTYGIGLANQTGLRKAVLSLPVKPDHLLIDAFYIKNLPKRKQTPIIKGDQKSLSIAAASILAKVYRDSLMESLPGKYHCYEFSKNKGYGTADHRLSIKRHGLSNLHRTSFSLDKFL